MRLALAASAGIDRLNRLLGWAAAWMVLAAALISAGNATSRYLFDLSSNAWLEIQWYLFAGIVLLGAADTLRRNEHVRVDLVYSSVSDRARLWIDVGGIVVFLLPFALVAAWLCVPVALRSWETLEGSPSAGGLLRWPVKALIPLGFLLLALQGLSELVKRVAALRGLSLGEAELAAAYEKPQQ